MPKMNKNWELRDGKAVMITPAVEEKVTEVPKKHLERELAQTTRRKEAAAAEVAEAQAKLDELTAHESEIQALIDQMD
jgi:hypothetical protein